MWSNEIALLLSYWLQQRSNHDDIFGRLLNVVILEYSRITLILFLDSSFRSANAHTDSLGEVDVISDAEVCSLLESLLKYTYINLAY